MKRPVKVSLLVFAILVAAAGYFTWKNWHDRYVWPPPVASMQDLPPLDRSRWPASPVKWQNEIVMVETATPEGNKPASVTYYINSIGMKLVRIEPGTFRMGVDGRQLHRSSLENIKSVPVTLTHRYYLGAFEVTNEEYEQFDPAHAKRRPDYQQGEYGNAHPVEPVTWQDAQRFCRWLSEKEGRLNRLPAEAEWEYACKAGTTNRLYWGDTFWDRNKANAGGLKYDKETWKEDGYIYSAPVRMFPANPWGLFDMIGNSWEWVQDWFGPLPKETAVDPQGGPNIGRYRIAKGGGWSFRTRELASSVRDGNNPADLHDIRGFRVCCEELPEPAPAIQ